MITLFAAGAGFGLPEISPYVTKTEVQLMMAGLTYRKTIGSREAAPKGQLPWIEDAAQVIGDSTFIRVHIERRYDVDLDLGLSGKERAQAWAIERMVENQARLRELRSAVPDVQLFSAHDPVELAALAARARAA